MSGIAGIFRLDGEEVSARTVQRIAARSAHRGPDGAASWSDGSSGLAHAAFHTNPGPRELLLPPRSPGGALAVTADARLDNRGDLLREFGLTGASDSELILAAYERWGERCPERLGGDFSFAVLDRRRRILFCARDPLGVKPFAYALVPGRLFAFASEPSALRDVEGIADRLNELKVAEYLAGIFEDRSETFFRDVRRLPPGTCLTADTKGIRLRTYWSPDGERELRLRDDGEYAEAFRSIFADAVGARLRSAVRTGALLSGGLDTSSIVCVARGMNGGEPLETFSAHFDGVPESDERNWIDAVVDQGGVVSRRVRLDGISPLEGIERMLRRVGEPFPAPNLFMHWRLYDCARSRGVGVLLDGLDGDTVVSHGIGALAQYGAEGRWADAAREVRGVCRGFRAPAARLWLRYVLRPLAPQWLRRIRRWNADGLVRTEFAKRVGFEDRARELLAGRDEPARTERREHGLRLSSGIHPLFLEIADRAAASFGIEPRYPFFDRRLVEFCLALPPEQKIRGGTTRIILRRALRDLLPEAVRRRPGKADLGPNFDRSLRRHERPRFEAMLRDPAPLDEFADMQAVRRAGLRFLEDGARRGSVILWRALTLWVWLRSEPFRAEACNPSGRK